MEIFKIHTLLVIHIRFHIAIVVGTHKITYSRPTVATRQRPEDNDIAYLQVRMGKHLARCHSFFFLKSISVKSKKCSEFYKEIQKHLQQYASVDQNVLSHNVLSIQSGICN